MNQLLDFLTDDYSEPGYIQARPGLHGELRFVFRPVLVEERSQLFDAIQKIRPDAADRRSAAALAAKLVSWSLVDRHGASVAITAGHVLRLRPALFNRLFAIVMGTEAGDLDPDWPETTKETRIEEQYESALSGQSVGELREARDEKN